MSGDGGESTAGRDSADKRRDGGRAIWLRDLEAEEAVGQEAHVVAVEAVQNARRLRAELHAADFEDERAAQLEVRERGDGNRSVCAIAAAAGEATGRELQRIAGIAERPKLRIDRWSLERVAERLRFGRRRSEGHLGQVEDRGCAGALKELRYVCAGLGFAADGHVVRERLHHGKVEIAER